MLLSETSSKETNREVGPAHLLCIEGAPSPIYRGNLGQSAISPDAQKIISLLKIRKICMFLMDGGSAPPAM